MTGSKNPWGARFVGLSDISVIKERAAIAARQLSLLHLHTVEASQLLEAELERILVPTEQVCKLLYEMLQIAKASSDRRYPNARTFLEQAYASALVAQRDATPVMCWCFTGLAGVGKSKVLAALERLLNAQAVLDVDAHHVNLPTRTIERLVVDQSGTETGLLTRLASPIYRHTENGPRIDRLRQHVIKHLYNQGTVLIAPDEMQFLTQSTDANVLVAKTLLSLMMLRVPIIYASNYSLCHRLRKRPQEERQRLLSRPIGMAPDEPDSPCWRAVVAEYFKACPEVFPENLLLHLDELHRLTSGLPRVLKRLLTIAFAFAHGRSAQRQVTIVDVRNAYVSPTFTDREDVEVLTAIALGKKHKHHSDLICPFEGLFRSADTSRSERARIERDQRVATSILEGSLTVAEQTVAKELRQSAAAAEHERQTVVPIRKRPAVTVEALRAGSEAMAKRRGAAPPNRKPADSKGEI